MLYDLLALTLPGANGQPGQTINPPASIPKGGLTTLQSILSNGITLFLIFGILLTIITIIWSGIQWGSSGGDKAKLQSARNRITWAVIGFILLLLSFFILNIIGYFFKVNLLNLNATQ